MKRKELLSLLLAIIMAIFLCVPVLASGDPNIDAGGGGMGSGHAGNFWNGEDGVRISVVRTNGAKVATFDWSNYNVGDIPLLPRKKRLLTRRNEDGELIALRNLLTPVGGLSFGVSRVIIGTVVVRVYGAMRYPSELDYGWAVELMNNSDCVTSLTYYPGDASQMGDALARSIKASATNAESVGDARRRKQFEKQAVDADRLLDEIDFKSSPIGHVSILAMPFCDNEEKLEDICRGICSRFAAKRIRLRPLGFAQKEAYTLLSQTTIAFPLTVTACNVSVYRMKSVIRLRESAAMLNRLELDSLTGLYSKEFFYHNVQELLRANPDARYDIVCSDIENIRSMNDRYGQAWCDRFLCSIAGRLVRRREAPDLAKPALTTARSSARSGGPPE